MSDAPRAAWLDAADDVATAVAPLERGASIVVRAGDRSREIVLAEGIATGHKFALRAIAAGERVHKYGEAIGRATKAIAAGAWVHDHNVESEAAAGGRPAPVPRPAPNRGSSAARAGFAGRRFDGYRRADGRVGVRNHVLVLSPTGLTSAAARRIASLVHGTIPVTSGYGRGQAGADADLHFATLAGLACHPNVAATLVVSAADDITRRYLDVLAGAGKPAAGLSLEGVRADAHALVDAGTRAATRLVRDASSLRREPCDIASLVVAVECGHSDATSGLVCNPVVGRMMDAIVGAGGRAMFSETIEWTGAEHLLAARAATPEVARRIVEAVAERERRMRASGGDYRVQNPGPQNRSGGITTLEEKALGAIAKGGSEPIRGLLAATEAPPGPGLFLMDTPFFSPESITAMVASGAQLVVFTTGGGNSYCSLVAPTLKASAHPDTGARLAEQIDFDASGALRGASTLDAVAQQGVERLLDIAGGTLTLGEIAGEGDEVVSRLGASL